jgi:dTDP-4-dehydrorhamnose reductase
MKLVFGGSGYIGQRLCEYLSRKNELLAGTYFHSSKKGLHYFDLEDPDITKLDVDLNKANYAIICSAMTNIDQCKADQRKSYKINVDGTKKLIEQLFQKNIFPIFFSSDHVFDGKKGNYSESDKTCPCTVYGSHKAIIENFLLNTRKPFLIARLSKIFGLILSDKTILTSWAEQFKNDETVRCATDQRLSFTYAGDLMEVLDLAMEKKLCGLYNMASPESFSRFELATMLKSQLNIKSGKIVPCSINDFNFLDSRSLDTSLNCKKIIKATGFKFSKMEGCISILKQ